MAGRKLVLEISTTGEKEAVANVRSLLDAVVALDDSLQSASSTSFGEAIASSAAKAHDEVERLITLLNSVPSAPVTPQASPLVGAAAPPLPATDTGAIFAKATQAMEEALLAETQALVEIQQLLNDEAISAEEAQARQLAARRKRIEAEITAERQKATALENLPSGSSADEEARQQAIRASHQKTADLQLSLAAEVGSAIAQSQERNAGGANGLLKGIVGVAFGFNEALQSIQSFAAGGQQAYQLLIGANEQLRQQILGSAASIVATSKVMKDGVEVTDPTAAIKAVQPEIAKAIEQVQKDTQQLVGVTSEETTGVYNVILSKVGLLQGQSKEFSSAIAASVPLASRLVATLGTMGLDLGQAGQEIGDLLEGEIGPDSTIARSLGIDGPMIQGWKAQGILVDELTKRMEPFMAGNALAAQSVSGITSNFQDLLQVTARVAGEPLLDALVVQLQAAYEFVDKNKGVIQEGATSAVAYVQELMGILGEALTEVGKILLPIGEELGEALKTGLGAGADVGKESLSALTQAAVALVQVASPLLQLTASLANVLAQVFDTEMGKAIASTVLLTAGLAKVAGAIQLIAPAIAGIQAAFIGLTAASAPLSAAFVAAGGGIAGMGAAMTAALPSIAAFGTSIALALGPLIALGGAVALVITIKKTGDLKAVNQEIEDFDRSVQQSGDSSIKLASQLKSLNDAQKENGSLTAEQASKRKQLVAIANSQKAANTDLIASIRSVKPANDEQAGSLKALEAQLTTSTKALDKQIEGNKKAGESAKGVEVANRSLKEQGTLYEQLAKKAKNAQDVIKNEGSGKQEAADQAAKDLIDVRQQQLELGKVTTEAAIADLEKIANNTKLSADVQQAAIEAVSQIREQEGERQVEAVAARENDIQKLAVEGRIGEAELEKRLTANKIAELNKRLEVTRAAAATEQAAGRGGGDKAKELAIEEKQIQSELAQTVAQGQEQQRSQRLKDFDERQALLDAAHEEDTISEEEYQQRRLALVTAKSDEELNQVRSQRAKLNAADKEGLEASFAEEARIRTERAKAIKESQAARLAERLKDLEEEGQKAAAVTKAAEASRLLIIQQSLNSGAISEEEANKRRSQSAIATTQTEIQAAEAKTAALRAIPPATDPEAEADRQAKIQGSVLSTTQLRIKLLEQERAAQQAAQDAVIKEIQKRDAADGRATSQIVSRIRSQAEAYDALNRQLENQQQRQDVIAKTLDNQSKLAQSRFAVEEAQSNLATTQSEIQITNLDRASAIQKELSSGQIQDSRLRKALEGELVALGVSAGASQVAIARERAAANEALLAQQRQQKLAELANQRELASIEERRNVLAAEREVREARIAENQAKQRVLQAEQEQVEARRATRAAQSALEQAKVKGDSEAILDAEEKVRQSREDEFRATEQVGLAQEDVGFAAENTKAAGDNLAIQAEVTKNSQDALAAQQATAIAQLNQAELSSRNAANLTIARAQAEGMANQLERAAAASNRIGSGATSTVGSRYLGGSMSPGQPYWVGEGTGGSILPTSEIIVPETQSYAIAASRAQEWLATAASTQFKQPETGNGVRSEQTTDLLYREIGQLRQELHNLRFMNPVQVNAEYHNTFAREDEQAFLDKQRRQQLETSRRIFKKATDEFYRGF